MKYIKVLILAICCTFIVSSCDIFGSLDGLPPNELVDENLFTTAERAEVVLNGVYTTFYNDEYYLSILLPPLIQNLINRRDALERFDMNEVKGISPLFPSDKIYSTFYKLVNRANIVISNVTVMKKEFFKKDRQNEILASARFLRALGHFDVLRLYGYHFDNNSEFGVIVRNEPSTIYNRNIARSTVANSYKSILKDLDYAIKYAPSFKKTGKNYVSKIAAKALKCRVLLYQANADKHDKVYYQEIIKLSKEILAVKGKLEKNFEKILTAFSTEVILEVHNENALEKWNKIKSFFEIEKNGSYEVTKHGVDLIGNDARKKAIIKVVFNNWGEMKHRLIKYHNREAIYLLRTTEVYLMAAEAYARLDKDEEARKSLNVVRVARKVPVAKVEKGQILLRLIYEEIQKDLCFEGGHEFFALIRQGQEKLKKFMPKLKSLKDVILPIPEKEILLNKLCKQNN